MNGLERQPDNVLKSPCERAKFSVRSWLFTVLLFSVLILFPLTAMASLNLAIAINPEPAAAGDYLNVALTVSNTNTHDDLTDVVLTLPYPDHLASLNNSLLSDSGFASYGSSVESGEIVTWNLDTLPAGTSKTVTLPPMIKADTPIGTIIEFTPSVSHSSGEETTAARSVTVVSNRVLELVAAADAEPVQPGGEFRYTLTYGHTATSAVAPEIVMEFPLPDGVSFVSATNGGILDENTIKWDLGTLDPGQTGRSQVTLTVDGSTALGSLLQTQAVINSTSQPDMIARADTVTRVEEVPPLLLSLEILPEPAEAGEYLDVVLTVSNPSELDQSNVMLRFRYPEHLASLENSRLSDSGYASYGYSVEFGEFVTWNLGTLPAGSSTTVTLPPMIGADTPAGTLIEIAPWVYNDSKTMGRLSRCISVENNRVLELVVAADAEPVQPGDPFRYTLTYGHTATSTIAPDTVLELPLPDGVSFVSATNGGVLVDDIVQWDLGTQAPGQIGRAQVTVVVDESTPLGSPLQTQAVFYSTTQPDILARADTVTGVAEANPLLLAMEVLPEPAGEGEYLDMAITVSNSSLFDRSEVVLQFRYPEHLASLNNTRLSDSGYASYGYSVEFGEFVTWNLGTLPAGTSKTVTLPPMIEADTPAGTLIKIAPCVYDSSEQLSRISRCISVENNRVLELVATADAESVPPGEEFKYTLTYGHTATSAVASDMKMELPLPNGVSFVSATGGGTLADDVVQWDIGTLYPGQIGRVQLTVAVDASMALGGLLQAQAVLRSTSQPDIISRADTVTQVEAETALLLSFAVRSEPVEAGEYLDVALTVGNTSLFDRSDVVVQFRYPEHLASLDNTRLSDSGYASYGYSVEFGEFVTWNIGTLLAGSTKTVTLPPRVTTGTPAGELIKFTPEVSDSSGSKMTINRCIAVENERVFDLALNTGMDVISPGELLTYTLSYGHRATSVSNLDTILELPLPDDVSFVSASGGGTLDSGTVQWPLGTLEPGQVDSRQVTVAVDPAKGFGSLLDAQAVLRSVSQLDKVVRTEVTTKIEENIPLLLATEVTPDPTEAGEQLDARLTVTNTSLFDRSDVILKLRYPLYLDSLSNNLVSDDGYASYGYSVEFGEFVTWDLGTLLAGSEKTVTLPPTVASATIDGTIIDFDAVVSDATALSRVEHAVRVGQLASDTDSHVLTVEVIGDGSVADSSAGISCPGDCSQSFSSGTQVTLTATPNSGMAFKEWSGDCSGTATTCVLTMSEDRQVTATFVEQEAEPRYLVLSDDTPVTLVSSSDNIVYGSQGANAVVLESGAVAGLKNFPGSNTITILSDSSLFTVFRSGATVTFTGTDGTVLKMPATTTAQSIIFNDQTVALKTVSGTVMLGNQVIMNERAAIE